MKHAVFLPPTGALSDPVALRDLAVAAEERGWDGVFVWDHLLRPEAEPQQVADPWIVLAAIASATTRIRLGPMVTPLVRRRPQKVAREAATLDHLSGGRVILGLGLGVDTSGELSKFGEVVDARTRGDILDEGAALLDQLWSGEPVTFEGRHHRAIGVRYLPPPVQRPRIPMWFAARGRAPGSAEVATAVRPVRRAARYDGLVPIEVDADGLARMLDLVRRDRGDLDGFDVAADVDVVDVVTDPEGQGITWSLTGLDPPVTVADALRVIDAGPPS